MSVYDAELKCQIIALRPDNYLELIAVVTGIWPDRAALHAYNMCAVGKHDPDRFAVTDLTVDNSVYHNIHMKERTAGHSVSHPVEQDLTAVRISLSAKTAWEPGSIITLEIFTDLVAVGTNDPEFSLNRNDYVSILH